MCGFLTSSVLIDEVNNYTGVILRIACFDLNCPIFTWLDFWHRLSSILKDVPRIRKIEKKKSNPLSCLSLTAVYYVLTNTILNYHYFTLNSDLIFSKCVE